MFVELATLTLENNTNYFFGYFGIACALVFASTIRILPVRPGLRLRNRQERRRHHQHGSA